VNAHTAREQVLDLLRESGFVLERSRRHNVWKHTDGRVWVVSQTPSDWRSEMNNLSNLKQFLARGKARGTFDLTEITDHDRERARKVLQPERPTKVKPIKERNFGILIEKWKPVIIPTRNTIIKIRTETPIDCYAVGATVQRWLQEFFHQRTRVQAETSIAEDLPIQLEEFAVELRKQQLSEDIIKQVLNDHVATVQAQLTEITREEERRGVESAIALRRVFQRVWRKVIDEQQARDQVQKRLWEIWQFEEHDANHVFDLGLDILKYISQDGLDFRLRFE